MDSLSQHTEMSYSRIDALLDEKVLDYDLLNTIVTLNPHKDKKEKIFQLIEKCEARQQKEFFSGMAKTIEMFERTF